MKKSSVIVVIGILAILIIAGALYLSNSDNKKSDVAINQDAIKLVNSTQNSTTQPEETSPEKTSGITSAKLAEHNTLESCWVGYKGKVYDITDFLPKHPGSAQAILPNCGTAEKFEQSFTKKHGTSKVSLLMKVGVLMGDFDYQGNLA